MHQEHEKFCILPFNSMQVSPFQVTPCCKIQFFENIGESWSSTFENYISNGKLQRLQEEFLDDKVTMPCSRCFIGKNDSLYPDVKYKEFQTLIEMFGINQEISKTTIQFLNIQLGSVCNLQCRHCSPQSSSSLGKIWDSKYEAVTEISNFTPQMDIDGLIDEIKKSSHFDNVEAVLLSGGEPLMNKRLREFVTELKSKNVKKIGIVSNLSSDPFDFLEFFSNFDVPRKAISISLDGDREMHQYYRHLIDMGEFEKNCAFLNTCKSINKAILMSVSAMNVYNLPKAIAYAYDLLGDDFFFQLSIVENIYLKVGALPINERERLIRFYDEQMNSFKFWDKRNGKMVFDSLQKIRSYIIGTLKRPFNEIEFKKFVEFIKLTDSRYNSSFNEVCPELGQYVK